MRPGLTERLARASAAHPRRTFAGWGVAIVAALVLAATSLHGLTSNASVSGTPESSRAATAIFKAFPPTPADLRAESSDVVIVTSGRYAAGSPRFTTLVATLVKQLHATSSVLNVVNPPLVSKDGHAVLLQILLGSDAGSKPVVALAR